MTNVCIIGLGLIGGSLGMALRRLKNGRRRLYSVNGLGRSHLRLNQAKVRGAVDGFSTQPGDVLPNADIVVLATPVSVMGPILKSIATHLKPGVIITDVGSVKGQVLKDMRPVIRRIRHAHLVGGHPLAGSEKTGIENADGRLFDGSVCVITKDGASSQARARVRRMWTHVGARCLTLSAHEHDRLVSLTSHLPHLLSFALFSLVSKGARRDGRLKNLVAGSFRDMTRIAASDAELWTGVFSSNRAAMRSAWNGFSAEVRKMLTANTRRLRRSLSELSTNKQRWIKK